MRFLKRHPNGVRLFGLALLTLYLELALIRFTSAEVLYLGYFSNFVLISVFLGIGLGFLASKKPITLFQAVPVLLFLLVLFVTFLHMDVLNLGISTGQLYFAGNHNASLPIWFGLPALMIITVLLFAGIAQETARCFSSYVPLTSYSLDIAGSLAGIVLFTSHSYFGTSPVYWFLLSFGLLALLSFRKNLPLTIIMGICGVTILALNAPNHYVRWSPYQKIEVFPRSQNMFFLTANGIGHQTMLAPSPSIPFYNFPYQEVMNKRKGKLYESALIIGAGSGTDVSYALMHDVKQIDAVEIDPVIQKAGVAFHPSQPYRSNRVTVSINDGRAFMATTKNKYDLIIFALPDSLALLSSFSSIRLESFLFTVEAFTQAKKLLKDDGVVVLYNYYREPWLAQKLAKMLELTFGHPAYVVNYPSGSGLYLSALAAGTNLSSTGTQVMPEFQDTIATDDWPFLYMQRRFFPSIYLLPIFMFLSVAVIGILLIDRSLFRGFSTSGPFFLMGVAFLLLETKSIIQFSLLFGATWLVNSLVFFAILISILLANQLAARLRLKSPYGLFGLLIGSLLINYALPLETFLNLHSFGLRYVTASVVFFSPIFFANLLFGYFFKSEGKTQTAFGWNILGAMVGGCFEYSSVVLGYRNLTLVAAGLYILCIIQIQIGARGPELGKR